MGLVDGIADFSADHGDSASPWFNKVGNYALRASLGQSDISVVSDEFVVAGERNKEFWRCIDVCLSMHDCIQLLLLLLLLRLLLLLLLCRPYTFLFPFEILIHQSC